MSEKLSERLKGMAAAYELLGERDLPALLREAASAVAGAGPVSAGQLWRDVDGHARICGVVLVEKALYAVLLRTRGSGGRKRRPFLFPAEALLRGDDGWTLLEDASNAR